MSKWIDFSKDDRLTIRFKTPITPYVSGGGELNGGIRDGLNGGLNDGQKKTLEYICQHEGCNTKQISIGLDVPFDTIEKQIRILLKKGLIEHRGSKKTGGYYPRGTGDRHLSQA